ncbi:MAG: helix-turn-helix transcriptional regulator [Bacilli bacterium]|nr:helix-turn-helix transcriptional regulator [Bacilli bacterium]
MTLFYNLLSDLAGRKIKKERQAWGMSRRKLARLVKTDEETIKYIENGYVCMLDSDLLRRISEVLDVNMFDFFKRKLSHDEILAIV